LAFSVGIFMWFVAISIVGDLTVSYGALTVQAAAGLFAVIVLLGDEPVLPRRLLVGLNQYSDSCE